ncbi:MAG TPA: hypothetical protein VH599_05515 [Ktedonobacterales bacterium]|jgi:hypothetical protein
MAQSTLIGKQFQRLPHQPLLKTLQALPKILAITLLVFSILALTAAILFDDLLADPFSPVGSQPTSLLYLLVVAGGSLLLAAGWRFPAARLTLWQSALILLGISLGLAFSLQHVAYQYTCCMFAYQIGYGYPFPAAVHSFVSENYLSWSQVYALMRQHPNLIDQRLAWPSVIANSMFYAHAVLIPVVTLRAGLRLFARFAHRQ